MPAQPELTAIERDKLTINPDFDFRELAKKPLEEIPANHLAFFKWTGIYQQLQKGFFMMRIRIPGGLLKAPQVRRIADLAEQYAQGQLCLTTRQTFQFHWLRLGDLYKVLESLKEVGLDTKNACGDVTRNVVTCPLQGGCPLEVKNVRTMIETIANDPEIKDRQRNLPRKHKISVAGCGRACGQTLMNCQGWYPVSRKNSRGVEEIGWRHHAGGGLGARPYMGKTIFEWVPEDLVLEVTRAVTEVFRRLGNRRMRGLARLKLVVDQLGAAGFADKVLEVLRERNVQGLERLEKATAPAIIGTSFLDGQAVIAQRQSGLNTVRVMILRGEMTAVQARQFAGWAEKYGDGTVMLTARQNIQLCNVPTANVAALLAEIHQAGFNTEGHERLPDMVACVGTTMCNLAVSDTPNAYRRLYAELAADKKLWEQVGTLRMHMNGCPNSCAQHWMADIGLRGMRKAMATGSEEGFSVCIGGGLDAAGHIAQPLCDVTSSELVSTVRKILEIYLAQRSSAKETFGEYARRIGNARYTELLGIPQTQKGPANLRNLQLQPVFEQGVLEAGAADAKQQN